MKKDEYSRGFNDGLFHSEIVINKLLLIYLLGSKLSDKEKLEKFPEFVKNCLPLIIEKEKK